MQIVEQRDLDCAYFDAWRCRSCTLLETPYARQLAEQQARIEALLPEMAWDAPHASAVGGFRNKAKMAVAGTLDAPTIGLILGVATGLRFLVSIGGAELSDRVGRLPIILVGMVVLAVGLVAIPGTATPVLFAVATWTLAMGRIGNSVPIAMLSDVAEPRQMGRLIGLNRFVADLGLVSGPVAIGLLIEGAGFGAAFAATLLLVLVTTALLVVAASQPRHRRSVEQVDATG